LRRHASRPSCRTRRDMVLSGVREMLALRAQLAAPAPPPAHVMAI
jgi:hypothetical protein